MPPPAERPARSRLPVEERQAQILTAAVEEFAERGYAGARMAAVARRAAVTKGLLYHYHPGGKADLFRAAIGSCARSTLEELARLRLTFSGSCRAQLVEMFRFAYEDRLRDDRRDRILLKLMVGESGAFPELAASYRAEILDPAISLLQAVLREGEAAGEFRAGVATDSGLAHVLLAPLFLGGIWDMILGRPAEAEVRAQRASHIAAVLRLLEP